MNLEKGGNSPLNQLHVFYSSVLLIAVESIDLAVSLDDRGIQALASDTRRKILKMLLDKKITASDVSRKLGKHVTTVTEHLELLVREGFVSRHGSPSEKFVFYSLTEKGEQLVRFNGAVIILFVIGTLAIMTLVLGGSFIWVTKFQGLVGQQMNKQLGSEQRCEGIKLSIDQVWIKGTSDIAFTLRNAGSYSLKPDEWHAITVTGGVSGKKAGFSKGLNSSGGGVGGSGCFVSIDEISAGEIWNSGSSYTVSCPAWVGSDVAEDDVYSVTAQPHCGTPATNSVVMTAQ